MERREHWLPPRHSRGEASQAQELRGTRRSARQVFSPADRHRAIAVAAYFRAERRGFAPGGELADWFAAEREVDRN
jgi:Protein of unknown function (DUF2934)